MASLCVMGSRTRTRWHPLREICGWPERTRDGELRAAGRTVTMSEEDLRMRLRAGSGERLFRPTALRFTHLFTILGGCPGVVLFLHSHSFLVSSFRSVAIHE